MKLSKIISTPNLKSVTISVINENQIVCHLFIGKRTYVLKKKYKSLDVDVDIKEVSNGTVEHLGIKKFFYLNNDNFYVNLYYY